MITNCQLLLESISDALLMLDKDGFIKYANPSTATLTGYTTDELLNQHLSVLYNIPDNNLQTDYELSQAQKVGQFYSEGWRTRKDGSRFWGEMTLSPIAEGQYEFAGFSCLLRNISERKTVELDLRQSEERYRLMVEGVQDYAIFMLDPTGHILTWNDGAKRIKGYSSYEIIGRHFSTFYTAEDLQDGKPARELDIAVATGRYEEEGWRVRKNGSVFWANVVITALFNEQNKHIGFSKVTRDLSERKENDENLRQSEERYRSLVQQVTDYAIFMLDEKGRIISWNEGARNIKGYQPEEIIGKYFSIFYPEEDILNGKPPRELKIARETGKYEEEGWRLRKDGSRFWANVVITAVYNTNGILLGYSKVTRDLTERKEAERALRDSYQQYRRLADELKKTNEELSYANSELEQFTYIVSHDLQEPVRTIKSFLQLIDMKIGEEVYEGLSVYIQKSITAANRMRELIRNLLHYSQLSRGEILEEDVNVDDLIAEVLQNIRTSVEASHADITVESDVTTVLGDRVQLVQLLQNLVSNAVKFTDKDDPQVEVRCREENGAVTFSVSDNGIGIAPSDLSKVFDIFRRLNTQKEYPGTGIGLAICKKIVDRHHGRIWLESEPGKGTTFFFTLHEKIREEEVQHEAV